MKRYWVFRYEHYYPSGGMNDFVGSFDTFEEASKETKSDNAHILDQEKQLIYDFYCGEQNYAVCDKCGAGWNIQGKYERYLKCRYDKCNGKLKLNDFESWGRKLIEVN